MSTTPTLLAPSDTFVRRHVAPSDADVARMLEHIGVESLEALVDQTIPSAIRLESEFTLRDWDARPLGEHELIERLRAMMSKNELRRSLIGIGYHDTIVPPVIQRNVLENPGWYTQYTPYQAEIAQGRLEALLMFQTMIADLTGLPLANASLLDEATAAAEAMTLCWGAAKKKRTAFLVSNRSHPQTIAVLQTRADAAGLQLRVVDVQTAVADGIAPDVCGVLVQSPDTWGRLTDPVALESLAQSVHDAGALLVVASDPLAMVLTRSPGSCGVDVCIGSSQRFGVPLGYGGPHAAFMSAHERHKRFVPGRIIGVSKDTHGNTAYRMAMQTREQHIRRERATSNICTAQVLLAIMAGFYGVWHGPEGLRTIARRVRGMTQTLAAALEPAGATLEAGARFDSLRVMVEGNERDELLARVDAAGFNLRIDDDRSVGLSLDEKTTLDEVRRLAEAIAPGAGTTVDGHAGAASGELDAGYEREDEILTHPNFHDHHAEHEMLRLMTRLQARDLSLTTSMISLGSCTMKLNATSEMIPVSWPETAGLHPFVPLEQAGGYAELIDTLSGWLCDITGFAAMSLQPNAGSQGEYSGLLTIRAYHHDRGDTHRNVCLIPVSAHGTNPASAVMAGMKVVVVKCDDHGNIDVDDLRAKAEKHAQNLSALMVTYPSTHGVFESAIKEVCEIVHQHGGQVYLDGANMNAQVGICRPGDYGADVCHLNLHKTFCIPHGGGGPGMGPIGVQAHLAPYLPGHPLVKTGGERGIGAISAAPWGSPAILPISWVYIALMGAAGLKHATRVAILNANYMAARLGEHYPVLYRGESGRVAHEFILDLRPFKAEAGIVAEDVAKRLMDYGFHAPTMSFPVAGTLMIEPTESESVAELDRFCEAMIAIREEIAKVGRGEWPREDNPLVNAPHTAAVVTADEWDHPYSRRDAAFPRPWVAERKFWPAVGRIDNAWGDRHLVCSCPPLEDYVEAAE
jgi:glycine dehydrogenase